jgi:hypothetical protein
MHEDFTWRIPEDVDLRKAILASNPMAGSRTRELGTTAKKLEMSRI